MALAHRLGTTYAVVWWIDARSVSHLADSFASLYSELGVWRWSVRRWARAVWVVRASCSEEGGWTRASQRSPDHSVATTLAHDSKSHRRALVPKRGLAHLKAAHL